MTYRGTLYDTVGGHPVQGKWIVLVACRPTPKSYCDRYTVGQQITDAEGNFVIHNNKPREPRFFLTGYYVYRYNKRTLLNTGTTIYGEQELNDSYGKLYLK
ncbi:hypothetical protein WSM22_35920 [Cytophagales bacterium WSM2-2]|nr:hypothetical protein WSM22_35920 [Cytophagales bacterium WSM2-2]